MRIHKPNPQVVIVTKSRLKSIIFLSFSVGFFGLWYYNLLQLGSIPEGAQPLKYTIDRLSANPILWFFMIAPVLFILPMYKTLKIVVVGEQITIDGVMRTILKNQKQLVKFDEVKHFQIRTIYGQSVEHRLTAVLKTGKKIQIHNSGNSDEIIAIGDDVADIVKIKVVQKMGGHEKTKADDVADIEKVKVVQKMGGNGKTKSIIFVLAGLIMLMIGIFLISTTFLFMNNAIKTKATIIDLVDIGRDGGGLAPVFLFENEGGAFIKIESNTSSPIETFEVGDTIEIFYDPNNPYNAKINSFVQLWFIPTFLSLLGILFVILTLINYRKSKAHWDNEHS